MPSTYEPIYSTTFATTYASFTLTGLLTTYTDLVVVLGWVAGTDGSVIYVRFNSDTASNYSGTRLVSGGGGTGSYRDTAGGSGIYAGVTGTTGSVPSILIGNIMNYSNTTTYKTALFRQSNTGNIGAHVGLWKKTPEAITSITFDLSSGTYGVGTTINIYGIKAA